MERREFLKTTSIAASAFVIAMHIPQKSRAAGGAAPTKAKELTPNAFVEIKSDNTINFYIGQVEMGQNTYTTLAMCIAEELNVDWEAINIIGAPVTPAHNHVWGPFMLTGGSSSIIAKQNEFRKVGSALNSMLKEAAAKKWKVRAYDTKASDSFVINKRTNEMFTFGELVSELASIKVPKDPKIKDLKDCKIIGKPMKRHPKEAWAKVKGQAQFGIDVRVPNMKYAAVLHPTVFGATLKSFDASAALKRDGVLKVKQLPNGVAVIAEKWYIAKEALNDIKAVWDNGENANVSTESLNKEYEEAMQKDGAVMKKEGDSAKAFKEAHKVIEAEFNFPFLAHAPMEPLNCVVHDRKTDATVWSSSQFQTLTRGAIAKVLGKEAKDVDYKTPYLGGAFGRRAPINLDYLMDATFVAKGEAWPVMTLWTREDDIKMGNYRPMYKNKAKLALNKDGEITAFDAKVVSQSIFKGSMFEGFGYANGVDGAQKEGLSDHPYDIENSFMQAYITKTVPPVLWWRSVGHTQSSPFVESLIDMAANEAGSDPIEYRINMLKDKRHIDLLEEVAALANWKNRKKEKDVGYGVAIHKSFGSIVAQIAKVRVSGNDYKVEDVWCSVDCGFAFNPLNVENQMISGINFALAATKYSEITLDGGAAVQNNFYDYEVSRISDAPNVKVSIINSMEQIGGIGEPGTPPMFAAVTNALFDATGKRFTNFPIKNLG